MSFENYVALEAYYRETTEHANTRYRLRRKKERRRRYTNMVIAISVGMAVALGTVACGVREMVQESIDTPTVEVAVEVVELPTKATVKVLKDPQCFVFEEDCETESEEEALLARAISIGVCRITHYCCEKRKHICGTGDGITASGTQVTPYYSVAVDPKVIPLGSLVYINGQWYRAEDTGGAIKGNRVDIAVTTHQEALKLGVLSAEVFYIPPTV